MIKYIADNKDALDIIIKIIGSIIAFGGLMWTLYNGFKTLNNYASDKKSQQISNLILLFADQSSIKRLSSVNGLTKNIDSLFTEIFLLTTKEEDINIKKMLYDALIRNSKKSCAEAIALNSFYTQMLLEDTYAHPTSSHFAPKQIEILNDYYTNIRIEREISKKANFCFSIISTEKSSQDEIIDYILLSSKIISNGLEVRKIKSVDGLTLLSSSFYSVGLEGKSFNHCILQYNIFRHSIMKKCNFLGCSITNNNNFLDVVFYKASFIKNEIHGTVFRKARFNKSVFENNDMQINVFSHSVHTETAFYGNNLNECKFKGCELNGSTFINNKIKDCEMQGSKLQKCIFSHTNIWSSDLNSCAFQECGFSMIKFGGTNLRNAQFIGCKFKDADFAGADLRNATFTQCDFSNVRFDKAKNYETVIFTDCTNN